MLTVRTKFHRPRWYCAAYLTLQVLIMSIVRQHQNPFVHRYHLGNQTPWSKKARCLSVALAFLGSSRYSGKDSLDLASLYCAVCKDSLNLASVYCALHCVTLVYVIIVFVVNLIIH